MTEFQSAPAEFSDPALAASPFLLLDVDETESWRVSCFCSSWLVGVVSLEFEGSGEDSFEGGTAGRALMDWKGIAGKLQKGRDV